MKKRKLIFRIVEDHQHLDVIMKLLDDPYPQEKPPFVCELEEEIIRDWYANKGKGSPK